ncbi:MAG: hypothetical protein IKS75_03580 [Clostridiales bacterium]|nr:hypothetical protein [Clostridiales bacterium]
MNTFSEDDNKKFKGSDQSESESKASGITGAAAGTSLDAASDFEFPSPYYPEKPVVEVYNIPKVRTDEFPDFPYEEVPVAEAAVEETPAQEASAADTPVEEAVVEEAPVEETVAEEPVIEETPAEEHAAEDAPADEAPEGYDPSAYEYADAEPEYDEDNETIEDELTESYESYGPETESESEYEGAEAIEAARRSTGTERTVRSAVGSIIVGVIALAGILFVGAYALYYDNKKLDIANSVAAFEITTTTTEETTESSEEATTKPTATPTPKPTATPTPSPTPSPTPTPVPENNNYVYVAPPKATATPVPTQNTEETTGENNGETNGSEGGETNGSEGGETNGSEGGETNGSENNGSETNGSEGTTGTTSDENNGNGATTTP